MNKSKNLNIDKYKYWLNWVIINIRRNKSFTLMIVGVGLLVAFGYNCFEIFNVCSIIKHINFSNNYVLSIIGIIYTFVWAGIKYKLSADNMTKDLFKDFNDRYTGEMNDLFEELRNAKSVRIAESTDKHRTQKNIIIDYFNLCAEEFYWYKKGRISSYVWKNWEHGILENLKIEEVYKLLLNESKRYGNCDSYYGFINYIKKVLIIKHISKNGIKTQ